MDGDGVPDCGDVVCDVRTPEGGTSPVDVSCTAPQVVVEDPWDVVVEWQRLGPDREMVMTPVIGNLTDDNGDGQVDEDDVPDIAVVAYENGRIDTGRLMIFSGDTGEVTLDQPGWDGGAGIALADIDGDGVSDVVGFKTQTRQPRAVRADGSLLWEAAAAASTSYPQATVADLDGDGLVEVIADTLIIDGITGAVEASLPILPEILYRMPAVGDLDLDGTQEVVIGNRVYGAGGELQWSGDVVGRYGHWSAIVNADEDRSAEVVMIGGGRFAVYEHDGTVKVDVAAGSSQPGAPCVADFDGDGQVEVAWASRNVFNLLELDGTTAWTRTIDDASGLASCSGYDFDGNGSFEILYADQNRLWVFDGADGTPLVVKDGHGSVTLWEYPAVADVDNDGSAEIVLASNGTAGWQGLTVFGHGGDGWMKSGTTWHTHDFAVTNILPDGSVPPSPEPWWLVHNVYRARPSVDSALTDLRGEIVDLCVDTCTLEGTVLVSVQLGNVGLTASERSVPWTLYRVVGDEETPLLTEWQERSIASGEILDSEVVRLSVDQLVGAEALVLRVDDDGGGYGRQVECREENNDHVRIDLPCQGVTGP